MEKIRFWEKKSKAKWERAWMVKVSDLGVQSEQSEGWIDQPHLRTEICPINTQWDYGSIRRQRPQGLIAWLIMWLDQAASS